MFNQLTDAQLERWFKLGEELGEVQQAIGKILAHGCNSVWPPIDGVANIACLENELGDVLAAIELLIVNNDVSEHNIQLAKKTKSRTITKYMHHQNVETAVEANFNCCKDGGSITIHIGDCHYFIDYAIGSRERHTYGLLYAYNINGKTELSADDLSVIVRKLRQYVDTWYNTQLPLLAKYAPNISYLDSVRNKVYNCIDTYLAMQLFVKHHNYYRMNDIIN